MRRFQFRLQAALDLRRRREEALRAELVPIQARLRHETGRLTQLLELQADSLSQNAPVGRVAADEMRARERYRARLEEEITAQRDLLALIQAEIERKIAEVVAAAQETRALEKVRDRHAEEHRREGLREEQRFLDDLASIRAARGPGAVMG